MDRTCGTGSRQLVAGHDAVGVQVADLVFAAAEQPGQDLRGVLAKQRDPWAGAVSTPGSMAFVTIAALSPPGAR